MILLQQRENISEFNRGEERIQVKAKRQEIFCMFLKGDQHSSGVDVEEVGNFGLIDKG